jgi:hypothetical protein
MIIILIKIRNVVGLKLYKRKKSKRFFDTPCKVAKYVNAPLTESIIKIFEVVFEVIKKELKNFSKVISL